MKNCIVFVICLLVSFSSIQPAPTFKSPIPITNEADLDINTVFVIDGLSSGKVIVDVITTRNKMIPIDAWLIEKANNAFQVALAHIASKPRPSWKIMVMFDQVHNIRFVNNETAEKLQQKLLSPDQSGLVRAHINCPLPGYK